MIQIQRLYKSFDELMVLNDVSLDIQSGTVTALLGPNASGKSTLIKCILGLVNPDRGRILIDDASIAGRWHYRDKVGYMPQIARFPENLTVDELFSMIRDLRVDAPDVDIELFARYELGAIAKKRLGTLSGGTRQKIIAALAFLFSPRILILDEPTVGLDPNQIREIRALIRELSGSHSVILSTHILPEVEAVCDRVQIMHRGSIVYSDTIEGLRRFRGGHALLVGLRNPPPPEELARLPGVARVEPATDGLLRVLQAPEHDPTDALVAAAAQQGWKLFHLAPERATLEDVFVQLTQQEAAAPAQAAEATA
jgi:ABC-2 type transport system ATP-binding protein